MVYYIYTLSDPITNQVRYVGKTMNLSSRYNHHLCTPKKANYYNKNWIKSLKSKNLLPIMEVVEEFLDEKECLMNEIYWISQFKTWGFKLTNLTEGGLGCTGIKCSEETKNKLSKIKTGSKFSKEQKDKLSILKLLKFEDKDFKDKIYKNLPKKVKGEDNGNAKLKNFQVIEIISRLNNNEKIRDIVKDYPTSKNNIILIKCKKSWKMYSHLLKNKICPAEL